MNDAEFLILCYWIQKILLESFFMHQVEKVIFARPQRLVVGTVVVNIAVAIESWGQKIKYSYSINQKK